MFITIKGYSGKFNAILVPFRKQNINRLQRIIFNLYKNNYGLDETCYSISELDTLKSLKDFVKAELNELDAYPYGFKFVDGVYCYYECIG